MKQNFSIPTKAIGIRIKDARMKLGFNKQKEFAEAVGVSAGFLCQVEKGVKKPSSELLFAMANKFDVNLNWILMGKGRMYRGKRGIDQVKERSYINTEERKLLKLIQKDKKLVRLLKQYTKLKKNAPEIRIQIILSQGP